MKLVEKKCPKCGADLSFDINSLEVTCNYCNTSFEIDRSGDYSNLVGEMINPELFNLHAKMVNKVGRIIVAITAFIFLIAIIIFFIISFGIFSRVGV